MKMLILSVFIIVHVHMESKYEEKETNPDENITYSGLILKLNRSQKMFDVLNKQNKELREHVDTLINSDVCDNTYLISTFDEYEKKIKKLQIDNDCLQYKIKSYETLMNNGSGRDNIDVRKDSVTCIICCDQARNVLFRPCNHILICDDCSGKSSYEECFVCRSVIVEYEYAYLL